jgi:hypothetical protein
MIEQDKRNFMNMINSVMNIYGEPNVELNMMRIWFAKLQQFDFVAVCKAFDSHTSKSTYAPTPADIIRLCPISTEYTKLPAPKMPKEESKVFSEKLLEAVEKAPKPTTDPKAWAKRIIANPKNYPDISLRFAKEALAARNVRV